MLVGHQLYHIQSLHYTAICTERLLWRYRRLLNLPLNGVYSNVHSKVKRRLFYYQERHRGPGEAKWKQLCHRSKLMHSPPPPPPLFNHFMKIRFCIPYSSIRLNKVYRYHGFTNIIQSSWEAFIVKIVIQLGVHLDNGSRVLPNFVYTQCISCCQAIYKGEPMGNTSQLIKEPPTDITQVNITLYHRKLKIFFHRLLYSLLCTTLGAWQNERIVIPPRIGK